MAGVRRDGWTHSPTPGRRAACHRGQQVRGPDSPTPPAGEPRWLCPELRFQFHDVTVQTCGLQAPAAAARPVRPPLPPARQARAPQPPAHPGRRRRSPARPALSPASLWGPAAPGPCVESTPAHGRGLCAALTQLVLGGGGGGRSHVAPGSERASEPASQGGREGRTGGDGGSRPSPCRVAPRRAAGARGRLGSLTRGRAAPSRPARRLRPPRGERRSRRPAPPRASRARDAGRSPSASRLGGAASPRAAEGPCPRGGSAARRPARPPHAGSYI